MKRSYLNIKEKFGNKSGNVYMKKYLVKETQPITENVYWILQTNIEWKDIQKQKQVIIFTAVIVTDRPFKQKGSLLKQKYKSNYRSRRNNQKKM